MSKGPRGMATPAEGPQGTRGSGSSQAPRASAAAPGGAAGLASADDQATAATEGLQARTEAGLQLWLVTPVVLR